MLWLSIKSTQKDKNKIMTNKKIFKEANNKSINIDLETLETFQAKVEEIKTEHAKVARQIRNGLVECVVIFIDLVDSTKFKIENESEPEKWILRVKQFGQIIKEYIDNSKGRVVKYIGDEVMGIFDKPTQIDDALGLILRIQNIQSNLTEITGFDTKVKIALDYGKVFLLEYEGHNEFDPQGTPIDRCARIGKYCQAGTILSSFEFVSKCAFPKHWSKVGIAEMKGLGNQPVFQYGEQTLDVVKKIEIEEGTFNALKKEVDDLKEQNQTLSLEKTDMVSTISQLQKQIKEAGQKPTIETDYSQQSEEETIEIKLSEIKSNIRKIKKFITESGVPSYEYGRFLFLNEKGYAEKYNSFTGKTFDISIEKDIVVENSEESFVLNTDNKRNIAVIKIIAKTQTLLNEFVDEYGPLDEDDLFEYKFSDADFWENYMEIQVT